MKNYIYCFALWLLIGAGCAPKNIGTSTKNTSTNNATPDLAGLRKAAPVYARTITAEELKQHLSILASDAYEGREAGEKGQKMAADYIKKEFKEGGLTGPVQTSTDAYLQPFDLERTKWGEVFVRVNDKLFKFIDDFYVVGNTPFEQATKLDVVFAGHGIDDEKYSDYRNLGLDVKGKAVVVFMGEPTDKAGNSLLTGSAAKSAWSSDVRVKTNAATAKGALAVFVIPTTAAQYTQLAESNRARLLKDEIGAKRTTTTKRAPAFYVSQELGAALLGTTPAKLNSATGNTAGKSKTTYPMADNVVVRTEKIRTPAPTENVLGYVEGTDKKEELIVVTAHYDHEGKVGDQIFNGADDDGSGTVAVLELAEAFAQAKKDGFGPRRSILFMAVSAEEKGLLGSEYYANNPIFPLANTVANLNIDMIGRLDEAHANNKDYVYVIGSDKLSSELHAINEQANNTYTKLDLDYKYNDPDDPNRFYYRSDHYNFAKNGIPVAFFFNGVHADYHKETDEVDKILFDKVEKIARLVFHTTWELANRDERIKVDSNKR